MRDLSNEICVWLNNLPDYYQAMVISFLCLAVMSQALDLGKTVGAIIYRIAH